MFPSTLLRALCAPVVAVTCIVCPSADATEGFEIKLQTLSDELAQKYFGTLEWPDLYNYLVNMKASGNPSWTDRYGNTLLEHCLWKLPHCEAHIIHQVLLTGVDPNLPERSTNLTPLHRAAAANDYRKALRLLAFGAKIDTKDKLDRTPADMTRHPQLRALLRGGVPVELLHEKAHNIWKKACQGDANAMWEVAGYYNDDSGINSGYISKWAKEEMGADVDEREKIAWVEQAAAAGHAQAQFDLGLRLVNGIGVTQDVHKGYGYIYAAEKKGLAAASEYLRENPQPDMPELVVPAELGDCTLTLTGRKKGWRKNSTYKMGYDAPMPKLKVFSWVPQGRLAEISFDGVGNAKAVHFNGTMHLKEREGNSFSFDVQGEMKGFDPKNFTAKPYSITITLNPEI